VIPTPASRLTSAPLRSVRRPGARPLDLENLYHTKRIAAIEWAADRPVFQAYDRSMMGDPVEDAALWRDRSPIIFVDRIRAPLLLLAGANDIRCPAEETRQIVEAVRAAGGIAEAKIYEHEGHGFARRENEIDAFQRVAAFLGAHLPPPRSRA
jgi:dipeptidyl aminopeptidase/acylaminoacyl peptidase